MSGNVHADTWHETESDAMEQAEFECVLGSWKPYTMAKIDRSTELLSMLEERPEWHVLVLEYGASDAHAARTSSQDVPAMHQGHVHRMPSVRWRPPQRTVPSG